MRNILLVMLACGALLAGCAENMKVLQGGDHEPTSSNSEAVIGTLGETGGYQLRNVAVPVPAGACDKEAFIEGYKNEYVLQWNTAIRDKQTLFELQANQNPGDPIAKHNHALYEGKIFRTTLSKPLDLHPDSESVHNRVSVSYQKGKNAAMDAVSRDVANLAAQERR